MAKYLYWALFTLLSVSFNAPLNTLAQERLITTEEPPVNYTEDGKLTGTTVDIIRAIKKQLNLNITIENMPWARGYMIAQKDPDIIIFTAGKSQERIFMGFHFIGPVSTRQHILWQKKGRALNIRNVGDIIKQKLIIGGMRDDWRVKYFEGVGAKVTVTTDHNQNIRKLMAGRIDLWISTDIGAPLHAKKFNIDFHELEAGYVFKEAPSYILISKGTSPDIVEKWKGAYSELIDTPFFDELSKKWSDLLKVDLGFNREKGFYVQE